MTRNPETWLVAQRRQIARELAQLAREISRAPAAEDQMPMILKLHGLWSQLGDAETVLQVLRGVPREEAGVWPSRAKPKEAGDATQAP